MTQYSGRHIPMRLSSQPRKVFPDLFREQEESAEPIRETPQNYIAPVSSAESSADMRAFYAAAKLLPYPLLMRAERALMGIGSVREKRG